MNAQTVSDQLPFAPFLGGSIEQAGYQTSGALTERPSDKSMRRVEEFTSTSSMRSWESIVKVFMPGFQEFGSFPSQTE
jgi:hypothetical protein